MIFCLTSVLNGMGRHCSFVESLRGASGLVHLGALDPRPVYGGPKATSGPRPALIAARGPSTGARRRTRTTSAVAPLMVSYRAAPPPLLPPGQWRWGQRVLKWVRHSSLVTRAVDPAAASAATTRSRVVAGSR